MVIDVSVRQCRQASRNTVKRDSRANRVLAYAAQSQIRQPRRLARDSQNGGAIVWHLSRVMTMQPTAWTYFLCDPRTPRRPRYVGMTTTPKVRRKGHLNPFAGTSAMQAWKRAMRNAGVVPEMVLVAGYPTREAALAAEWRLIERWRRRGLCDLNSGVEGRTERFRLMCQQHQKAWAQREAEREAAQLAEYHLWLDNPKAFVARYDGR